MEEPASKRVKTEATTQDQLQVEVGPGEVNEPEIFNADNVDDSSSSSGDSSSSDEEPELLPARPANTGELLNEYLVSSMQAIARTTDQFTQQFVNEATARIMAAVTEIVEELRGEVAPAERFDPRKMGVTQIGNPRKRRRTTKGEA